MKLKETSTVPGNLKTSAQVSGPSIQANTNQAMGYRLISGRGKPLNRVRRLQGTAMLVPGDPYKISGGMAEKVNTGETVNGVVESIELMEKDGPVSYDYLPAGTNGYIIGVEDSNAEYEVQIDTVTPSSFTPGAEVGVDAGVASLSPVHSTASVKHGGTGGGHLVRLVERPDNSYGDHAKVVVRIPDALTQ